MFEHSSFIPRRYGEDAVRMNNRLKGLKLFVPPEFEDADGIRQPRRVRFIEGKDFDKFLDELFKEIDVDKIIRRRLNTIQRPRVSICIPDEDDEEVSITPVNPDPKTVPHGYFQIDKTELDKFPQPEIVDLNKKDDDGGEKKPTSIFDDNDFKKLFGDCVGTKKFNEIFGLDENGKPDPKYGDLDEDDEDDDEDDEEGLDEGDAYEDDEPPYIHEQDVVYAEDEEEEEEAPEDFQKKDPFVFIANRLTFLIQTKLPIIFDTSTIETGIHAKVNYMSIAVNVDKTFPKIETENDLVFIMREFNGSEEIQGEINEFLKDTEYDGIWAFPSTIERNDVKIPAIRFVIYPKRKYYSFGPAFLNRNK